MVELKLPRGASRGALELRENLTMGQGISNYTVEYSDVAGTWSVLELKNEGCLTIGNRRIQYWNGTNVVGIRLTVETLVLASGKRATPTLRSVKVMDWSSSELDGLLAGILKVQ
jgi:hypothetical protein